MEEKRGGWLDRMARLMSRGREDTTPAVVHFAVLVPIAVFVGLVILAAVLVWVLLR